MMFFIIVIILLLGSILYLQKNNNFLFGGYDENGANGVDNRDEERDAEWSDDADVNEETRDNESGNLDDELAATGEEETTDEVAQTADPLVTEAEREELLREKIIKDIEDANRELEDIKIMRDEIDALRDVAEEYGLPLPDEPPLEDIEKLEEIVSKDPTNLPTLSTKDKERCDSQKSQLDKLEEELNSLRFKALSGGSRNYEAQMSILQDKIDTIINQFGELCAWV